MKTYFRGVRNTYFSLLTLNYIFSCGIPTPGVFKGYTEKCFHFFRLKAIKLRMFPK